MKRLIGIIFIVSGFLLGLSGCNQSETSSLEETITSGDLSRFGIPRVEKIGDWYFFSRLSDTKEQIEIRLKISKVVIPNHKEFASMLYFDEVEVIYPTSWKIVLIKTDNNFYSIGATKTTVENGGTGLSFFIGLLGQEFITKNDQKWYVKNDTDKKNIEVRFIRKDLYQLK